MDIAVVAGSAGLIGSAVVELITSKFDHVIGIDNDSRKFFFSEAGSTEWNRRRLEGRYSNYSHQSIDIRSQDLIYDLFNQYGDDIKLVVHSAAQPSHDWAARDPNCDFTINANGTLNLLEATRQYCPKAVFVTLSTNKVYGDRPNSLPLIELETRWEIDSGHNYHDHGIDEEMSIDQTKHSIFGVSKVASDIMTQEYGRYFGIKTTVFRCGCVTGAYQSGVELHGFLNYLMKVCFAGGNYFVYGYKGKQVRDNISSHDVANMIYQVYLSPRCGEVYNIGGSRYSNCSLMEAVDLCEQITGQKMILTYLPNNRTGDHIWYISDIRKFRRHYPNWEFKSSLPSILLDCFNHLRQGLNDSIGQQARKR